MYGSGISTCGPLADPKAQSMGEAPSKGRGLSEVKRLGLGEKIAWGERLGIAGVPEAGWYGCPPSAGSFP